MLPRAFDTPRYLTRVNVVGIALACAGAAATCTRLVLTEQCWWAPIVFGGSTLLCVGAAAALSRRPKVSTSACITWSIAFAALNAGIVGGAIALDGAETDLLPRFCLGFVAAVTLGAPMWWGALAVAAVAGGLPIAWANHLARRGLSWADFGEAIVGAVNAGFGLVTIALMRGAHGLADKPSPLPSPAVSSSLAPATSVLAIVAGVAVIGAAFLRERARRVHFDAVQAGNVPGWSLQATDAGFDAVYLGPTSAASYRTVDRRKSAIVLDRKGRTIRSESR